jgi:hypothetical protein
VKINIRPFLLFYSDKLVFLGLVAFSDVCKFLSRNAGGELGYIFMSTRDQRVASIHYVGYWVLISRTAVSPVRLSTILGQIDGQEMN